MCDRKYFLMLTSKVPCEGYHGLEVADLPRAARTFQKLTMISETDEDSDAFWADFG